MRAHAEEALVEVMLCLSRAEAVVLEIDVVALVMKDDGEGAEISAEGAEISAGGVVAVEDIGFAVIVVVR